MGARRTIGLIAASVVLGLVGATPAQAALTPGARYDAIAGTPKTRQFLTVSKDGSRLSRYFLAAIGTCNDGKPYDTFVIEVREPVVRVHPDGSFAKPYKYFDGVGYVRGRGQRMRLRAGVAFTGTSSADGATVTIAVTASLRGAKGLRCGAAATVSLARDGTVGAPLTTARLRTGTYGGASGIGPGRRHAAVTLSAFRMLAPGGALTGFRLAYTATCSDGGTYRSNVLAPLLTLDLGDRLDLPDGYIGGSRDGYRIAVRDRLRLRFLGNPYRYEGSYELRMRLKRPGRAPIRCVVPRIRFAGSARA